MLLVLGPDRLLYRGPPVDGAPHRHHALQLAVALGAPMTVEAEDRVQTAEGFVVAADTVHRLIGGAPEIALLYLEAESASAHALQSALPQAAHAFDVSDVLRGALVDLDDQADDATLHERFDTCCARWLAAIGVTEATPRTMDPRIADTLAILDAHPESPHAAATLAARVHLSPDRLMHLFAEHTGTSLRSYALWAKLRRVLREALSGANLTTAAHAAGFADSAHLSHSFKAMFGLPPRFLFERRSELLVRFR